jgi:tight adherence protein C
MPDFAHWQTPIAMSTLVIDLITGIALLIAAAVILLLYEARHKDVAARIDQVVHRGNPPPAAPARAAAALDRLRQIGDFLQHHTKLFSPGELAAFEQSLALAGLDPRRNLSLLLGAKAVLTLTMPILGFFVARLLHASTLMTGVAAAIGFVVGLRGAFVIVRLLRRPYANAVRRGLPDGFDLLVICTEAGLGLESALDRVAGIMRRTNLPTALQLAKLAEELRIMPDRSKALAAFGRHSGVDGMQRFTTILAQSLQFGTPLSQALRMIAVELRRQRANRLEARASRLPVLLIFPLLFFIMPCIMIVMVGPSVISLMHTLGQLKGGLK